MSVTAKLTEYYGFQIARAYLSNYRSSAFKARLVADLIRSKGVVEALTILSLTQKRIARVFEKLLRSALANALNNHGMEVEGLYLFRVVVNEAKTLKRYRPILRGRSAKIRKRGCHLEILLAQKILPKAEETVIEDSRVEPPKSEVLESSSSESLNLENKESLSIQSNEQPQQSKQKQEEQMKKEEKEVADISKPNTQESATTNQLSQGGENGTES